MAAWLLALCIVCSVTVTGQARFLLARFNVGGVVGEVQFRQESQDAENVTVEVDIGLVGAEEGNWTWALHQLPVAYNRRDVCEQGSIGSSENDLTSILGNLSLPATTFKFPATSALTLDGPRSIWGKSLVLKGPSGGIACSTIDVDEDDPNIMTLEARFVGVVSGTVIFRRPASATSSADTLILVNLFNVGGSASEHGWRLLATDVLSTRDDDDEIRCDSALILYDPGNADDTHCTRDQPQLCKAGELAQKHGPLRVGQRKRLVDPKLPLPRLEATARRLVLVLYDAKYPDATLACAVLANIRPRKAVAEFESHGVRGVIAMSHRSVLDSVVVNVVLSGLSSKAGAWGLHEIPAADPRANCSDVGFVFNPAKASTDSTLAAGNATYDVFAIGALDSKYGPLSSDQVEAEIRDPYLSLFGSWAVAGRAIVLHNAGRGGRTVCANLRLEGSGIIAEAKFTYPVSGKVYFEQLDNRPTSETAVLITGLLYSDDRINTTHSHRWSILSSPVGRDFLNWTARCYSAGSTYNPFGASSIPKSRADCEGEISRCAVGDLTRKAGSLTIAGRKHQLNFTRFFYVDELMPLLGKNSIVGRTLALHDDLAPAFRGDRLACAVVQRVHPLRVSASAWTSAERPTPVRGWVTVDQESPWAASKLRVDVSGLQSEASGYHVHELPVPLELDFPCSQDAVRGHFDPFNVTNSATNTEPEDEKSLDEFEAGDISGKFGSLDEEEALRGDFVDFGLSIFGMDSIVGRSIVIHKRVKNERWICSTLEVESPDKGRVVRALASFHLPNGFANGYVRLSQVVFDDGSASDTWLEVQLSYPGKNNRNKTSGHAWALYVNPVGYDATVVPQRDRCVAAGYRWNPFLVVDLRDDYHSECSRETPLRCVAGDVSGRQGVLDIGGPLRLFTDSNLPLTGASSVIGRSIVIFDQKGSDKRFACGNVYLEKRAVNVFTIKNPRRFSGATFMDSVRDALGVPPWMILAEAKSSREIHDGACVQVTVHFRGPDIVQLQNSLSVLLNTGRIERYVPLAPGAKLPRFGYRTCRFDSNNAGRLTTSLTIVLLLLLVTIFVPS